MSDRPQCCAYCDRDMPPLDYDVLPYYAAVPGEWATTTVSTGYDFAPTAEQRGERVVICPDCRTKPRNRTVTPEPRPLTDAEKIEALRLVVARCSVWLSTFAPAGNINIVRLKLDCDNALYLTEAKP